jgi:two-component system CitB family sensor kinase
VRRLAERQGGSAEVADADGGGAEFIVVLPEALTDPALAPKDATESTGNIGNTWSAENTGTDRSAGYPYGES